MGSGQGGFGVQEGGRRHSGYRVSAYRPDESLLSMLQAEAQIPIRRMMPPMLKRPISSGWASLKESTRVMDWLAPKGCAASRVWMASNIRAATDVPKMFLVFMVAKILFSEN